MNVTLLGPQRRAAAARAAVAELMPDGEIATVNAGWQERETDSGELSEVLGGRMLNLELYRRWQDVIVADEEYAVAERRLTSLLAEIQAVYAIRLHHLMAALGAIGRRREIPAVQASAVDDTYRALQDLDRWHLGVVAQTRAAFFDSVRLGERDSIVAQRKAVAPLVERCSGMVFAGGHVGVLLHVLHIFDVSRLVKQPVVAWSAGAMALSDRVVLYNDFAPQGSRPAELYADGLGVYSGVLPFPHPRRRLKLDDAEHLSQMARRFDPRTCLLLADGVRVDVHDDRPLPAGARVLVADGGVTTVQDPR